ncbi:GAF domain/GGDEF domain protein [hydrothermal vent metagenome]|uniref:GAF domain/GGDEF domain protein n=1 Tax=hydrothermal vent metagenome TaxID=652676 RepID=A0A1W1EJE3_9ZZZZ
MNAKKKTTIILSFISSIIFLLMIINVSFNFRNYGFKSVEDKALIVSDIIKHSLTAHMVNDIMDKREFFLNELKQSKYIKELWLVRSPFIIKQYGNGFKNEMGRDKIDNDVINSGVAQKVITESLFSDNTFRMTIPYKASITPTINCLKCHNAKEGDTLGAISIVIDMNELKSIGLRTVFDIAFIAFLVMLLIQIFTGRFITPYMLIFESIKNVMQKAKSGNYSGRVKEIGSKESIEVAKSINELIKRFQDILNEIEKKIDIFLSHKQEIRSSDPLEDVKQTISQLSDLYKFKRTIEHDISINDIYQRLIVVFKDKIKINNFTIIESNKRDKKIDIIYSSNEIYCDILKNDCRADRTNSIVDSCQFKNLCTSFKDNSKYYICLPYSISNDLNLIISIVSNSEEDNIKLTQSIHLIDDYIDSVKSEFITKKLMYQLKESSYRDALTNLYNRKYLEEFIDNATIEHNTNNINYGILMADIDYFKMINDTYGHSVGDKALKIIAKTIQDSISKNDLAVRYGGEEFIVILYNCDKIRLLEVAQKIRTTFEKQKIKADNGVIFTKTISIGGALLDNNNPNFWKVIKLADVALYDAKNGGRNRVEIFDRDKARDDNFDEDY